MTAHSALETSPDAPSIRSPRIRGLHPGWLASVMGTAILAVATYNNPGNQAGLLSAAHAIGVVIGSLDYVLAAVLLVAYAIRWMSHHDAAMADLRNPALGAMYGTVPGAILVLAVMTSVVGPSVLSASTTTGIIATLCVVGGLLALVLSVAHAYLLFTSEVAPAMVNGGFFIPPVVTIILPMTLIPLMPHVSVDVARLLLVLGYAFFGMGLLLFIIMLSLLFDRLVLHPLPGALMAPSLWIVLGPVGVVVLDLLALARAGGTAFGPAAAAVSTISLVVGTSVWGFGVWWLALAVALLVRYLRAGSFPYSLSWWAFTFPVGAFTAASITLARAWHLDAMEWFGVLMYAGLVGFWLVVAMGTIRATISGKVWNRG